MNKLRKNLNRTLELEWQYFNTLDYDAKSRCKNVIASTAINWKINIPIGVDDG